MIEQDALPDSGGAETSETTTAPSHHQDIDSVRDLILGAFSDLVPELVGGSTVGELIASVDVARKAFAAVSHQIKSAPANPISVPSGAPGRGQTPAPVDLSPSAKIAEGLRQRRAKGS